MHTKQEICVQQNPGGGMIISCYRVIVAEHFKDQNECLDLAFMSYMAENEPRRPAACMAAVLSIMSTTSRNSESTTS